MLQPSVIRCLLYFCARWLPSKKRRLCLLWLRSPPAACLPACFYSFASECNFTVVVQLLLLQLWSSKENCGTIPMISRDNDKFFLNKLINKKEVHISPHHTEA